MADKQNYSKKAQQLIERERVQIRRLLNWLRERLWVRPLAYSVAATLAVWLCTLADYLPFRDLIPDISADLIQTLLSVLTASMLGVATFAVASMVSAYTSVGTNATPRAFALIVSDDVSKRALSTFVGAFILGTIGVIALKTEYYDVPGRFALFCVTLAVYAWVIWTFVVWVDAIARLGRMATAIRRVEDATLNTLMTEAEDPLMGALARKDGFDESRPVYPIEIGYIEDIDMSDLQEAAEKCGGTVHIAATAGSFVGPGRAIAYIEGGSADFNDGKIAAAFHIGHQRWFSSDPRFGFVVLAQIASRALSPGVNDPGTAIDVLGSSTRLLLQWTKERHTQGRLREERQEKPKFPDVRYPRLRVTEVIDDAFTSIARDGAGQVEVMLRMQRNLQLLAAADANDLRQAAAEFADEALQRTRLAITYKGDENAVAEAAKRVKDIAERRRDDAEKSE